MIETLEQIDQSWLLWLNAQHAPFFDDVMFFVSGKWEWIPLYALILALIIRKYRWNALWIIAAIVLVITLSDQLANALKSGVKRFRPCKDPDIGHLVHLVNNYCRSSYGFVSGHAANSFALATFVTLLFRNRWAAAGLFVWSTLVSYSRIYLGVHYPGDVICGALLGTLIAWLVYLLMVRLRPGIAEKH
ncbi:MAG: phosphatase PAP2 family protein [Bacteroidales bacterium]|nr:phosphatase PAP2 family protein [Bacteroidales bacterium]